MSRIYIKGCMPSKTLREADLAASDQVWTMNNQLGRNYDKKWDAPPTAHFSLHGLRYEVECHGARYLEYLSEMPWPVYLWPKQMDEWDTVVAENGLDVPLPRRCLPFDVIVPSGVLRFSFHDERRYYTGSFAYLLAFALYRKKFDNELDEVHIVGADFNSTDLETARLKAAEWLEQPTRGHFALGNEAEVERVVDNLRGQGSGDESWARECMMYWAGRLEEAGVRVVTDEDPWLFDNKWLRTHAKDCPHGDDVRGLYGLDPCIGG